MASDGGRSVVITDSMRVAFHEAGHVAVARYFGRAVHLVTIVPDEVSGSVGSVHHSIPGAWFQPTAPWKGSVRRAGEQLIMISVAGLAAEMILDPAGVEYEGLGPDLDNALHFARFASGGEPDEASALVEWLRCRTVNLLREPILWSWTEELAFGLMESKTLSRQQVTDIINATNARR